jgi:hypothetical protein
MIMDRLSKKVILKTYNNTSVTVIKNYSYRLLSAIISDYNTQFISAS